MHRTNSEYGEIRLFDRLKSIVFLIKKESGKNDYEVEADQIIRWIKDYDSLIKSSFGINRGARLQSLYNREIVLAGDGISTLPNKLKNIVRNANLLGYGVSITVNIKELYDNFTVFKALSDELLLSSITIVFDELEYDFLSIEKKHSFIDDFSVFKCSIGLVGNVGTLNKYVLSNEAVRNTDITIYPLPKNVESAAPITLINIPPNPILPCATRFRLYVDYDGMIYPCLGLLGLSSVSLGNVRSPISQLKINNSNLKLIKLMQTGPTLLTSSRNERSSDLPFICEKHRLEVLNGSIS